MKPLGRQLTIDLYGEIDSTPYTNMEYAEFMLTLACEKAGATIISKSFHHFGEGFGYTGTIILAESHAAIHTWSEHGYAAIDIFMCGECDPRECLDIILNYFKPKSHTVNYIERGKILVDLNNE